MGSACGKLCGKGSKDAFDGPGRTLGSAPSQTTKASVPTPAKRTAGGKPHTLGQPGARNSDTDPRAAAAAAAEARATQKTAQTGDLQKKLDAQKRQTQSQTLNQVAAEGLAARGEREPSADAGADLQKNLDKQKALSMNQTLQQVSAENRAARQADHVSDSLAYN